MGSPSVLSVSASWTAVGEVADDRFGRSLAAAGDVNGDGYADVVVGANNYASNTGKAYLYLGSVSGLSLSASWTAVGEAVDDYFGFSVASAGDVNGDGYCDVVVGAFGNASNTGKAYLYLGSVSGLQSSASWTAVGEAAGDSFGDCVSSAGDINGDGTSDVLVGAFGNTMSTGKIYLYLGSTSGLSSSAAWTAVGESVDDSLGRSVASAGDVNGDGYSDIVVGAHGHTSFTGKVYVYTGSATGISTVPSWTTLGEAIGDRFGRLVSSAGDVNGDGYADILIGAFDYTSGTGKTYVYRGSVSGLSAVPSWTAVGEVTDDNFGRSVSRAGDVNGDGYSDILVGAYGYSAYTGKVYLYTGSSLGLSAIESWTAAGEVTGDRFGWCVSSAGDVNGDGYSDAIVGAWANASSTGKAYLYPGNGGYVVPLTPRQLRDDLSAPIPPFGKAVDGFFRITSTGRTPFGRGDVMLEWQTAMLGGTFDPLLNPIQTAGVWTDSSTGGAILTEALLLNEGDGPYIWRMRTRYRVSTTPFQQHGKWLTLVANGPMETDLRRMPACWLPDQPIWISLMTKSVPDVYPILHFQDPNQPGQVTGCHIRRSDDPSPTKSTWPLIATNIVDEDTGTPDIQWIDSSGDVSPTGIWYYQITAYSNYCSEEGPF